MTPKGHGVIRCLCDLPYDPKGHGDLCGRFDLVPLSETVTRYLEVAVTYFMTRKVTMSLVVVLPSLWPQNVIGSLEVVAVTYFMTPKVTVAFVVSLT